jgi:glycosyltransferase involved in cell wall biosynthesis
MAFVIFGDNFTFPEGDASTNRVHCYAKGFVENNISTYVVCFGNDYLTNGTGSIDGIRYFHPFGQEKRSNSLITRQWNKFTKNFKTIRLINKINKEEKISAIIVYTKNTFTHLLSFLMSRMVHAKLIIENSEHPLRYYRIGAWKKLIGNLKLKTELCTFDGILLITNKLIDFYKARSVKDDKILLVPSTVDPSRFKKRGQVEEESDYIGYFGCIDFDRDNVDLLINAFTRIHKNHDKLRLVLGGMYSDKEEMQVRDLIKENGIEPKVRLLGYMPREEIVRYVTNAHTLVLVRINDPDTDASYPSKLTEYLATGNPVISVIVSEIPDYLHDGNNCFLVQPGDLYGLSEKLEYVADNYEKAKEVAKRGQDLTYSVFNYKFQARRIIDFINKN